MNEFEFQIGDLVRVRKSAYKNLSPMSRTLYSIKSHVPLRIVEIYRTPNLKIFFYRAYFIDVENNPNRHSHLVAHEMLEFFYKDKLL